MLAHMALDVEAEVGQQTVHHRGVAELVLGDLGNDVLFLHGRGLGDPRHIAVAARQLRVRLHRQEMDEILSILPGHLVGGFQPRAPVDLRHHRLRQVAHRALLVQDTLPALRAPRRPP